MKTCTPLFLILSLFFSCQSNLFGQCNAISSLNIDDVTFGACSGGMQSVTVQFDLDVGAMGNASACLGYLDGSGEPVSVTAGCYDGPSTVTDGSITYDIPCDAEVALAGWTNPAGGGTFCSGFVSFQNPLPVELISFKGYLQNNQTVLEWSTATEDNNDYFEVQKSTNGRHFETIAKVDGRGTTDITQYYQYVDETPKRGNNYYRLKQVDFNGTYEIFEFIVVKVEGKDNTSVYPSQTHEMVSLELLVPMDKDVEIELYNLSGIRIQSNTLSAGDYKTTFDVSDLSAGVYFIRYINEDFEHTSKQFFKMVD